MDSLKIAITCVEIVVGVAFAMLIGDYLGNKFGRVRVAQYTLFTVVCVIVAFTIYAAISLNINK